MAMYVIADLHLHPQGESLQRAFHAFVSKLHAGDELYILGDLFNFFVGLDKHNAAQILVRNTLAEAKAQGIKSYFIRGNRDFLMTAKEAAWLNMELLPDVILRTFGAQHYTVLLSHGDVFCTNDLDYMRYFKQVHNPVLQCLFRALPMWIRRKIASSIREQSRQTERSIKGREFYGVVASTMDEYAKSLSDKVSGCKLPVAVLVHGHIHEFGQHTDLEQVQERYVVGDWGKNFSYFKLSFIAKNATQPSDATQIQITFVERELDYLFRADTVL